MKGQTVVAAVAALAGGASARSHRHAHELFKKGNMEASMCIPGCTTVYSTYYGEPTLHVPPPPPPPVETTTSSAAPVVEETTTVVVVPTPDAHTCPTPGTYSFEPTTVVVTETTTVCAATSTSLPSGTHTVGGVTTVVETETTIVCPVATVKTEGDVTTSVVVETTYVCPTPGTYTINPITTVVVEETVVVYPVVTTYCPGTYTAPAAVVTVTEVDYVYYCPFTLEGEPTPTPEPVVAAPPTPEPSVEETPEEPPVEETHLGGGDHYAMTYTPYSNDAEGRCKNAGEVMEDLRDIKESGFTVVRVYSTDCSTLENVGAACEALGMKMILGVFVKEDGCDYGVPTIKEQVDGIAAWAKWHLVELIVVGNECLLTNKCSPAQLKTLITIVREKCGAAGYAGPYTTAETTNNWLDEGVQAELCPVCDIVGAQIHPFFNPDTLPSQAGEFTRGQLDLMDSVCPGKTSVNLECGWPSEGVCNGVACPGHREQEEAIGSIIKACGSITTFFSYKNDYWKNPGDCQCETAWGCGDLFKSPEFWSEWVH